MKKIILTENQYKLLLKENQTPPVTTVLGNSLENFKQKHGEEALYKLQSLINNIYTDSENVDSDDNIISFNTDTLPIPFDAIKYYLQQIANGKKTFDELANRFPNKLKGGLTFRSTLRDIFSMEAPETSSEDSEDSEGSDDENINNAFNAFANKFVLSNCNSMYNCDYGGVLSKISNIIPSNVEFDPKNVKVLEKAKQIVIKDGKRGFRDVIHVQLGNGQRTLFYSSSGSNVETTGKKAGEWFMITGFASNGWFFKTDGTVNLTKGGNQYLTTMAKFLEKYGINALG